MSPSESHASRSRAPVWLRVLAGSVALLVAAAALYALVVGLENWTRIGV